MEGYKNSTLEMIQLALEQRESENLSPIATLSAPSSRSSTGDETLARSIRDTSFLFIRVTQSHRAVCKSRMPSPRPRSTVKGAFNLEALLSSGTTSR